MTRHPTQALALALAACAGGSDTQPDARVYLDAPVDIVLADTPPLTTLSQTTTSTLDAGTSKACLAAPSGTAGNNYYRVFDLAALGITTDFHVYRVEFQVEHCRAFSGGDGCDVTVRVGTYSGTPGETLAFADMVILESAEAHIPEIIQSGDPPMTPGGTVTTNFDTIVPGGVRMLVEVDAPNGASDHQLFMGANDDGESAHAYVLAPHCNITPPTNINTVAGAPFHLLLTVSGTY